MKTNRSKIILFCSIAMLVINLYEFYLVHKSPNLPSLHNWILLHYPYEKFLNVVLLSTPVFFFLFWLLSYEETRSRYYRPKPRLVKYFIVDRYKWEVREYKNEEFFVDETPFCAKHNLRMINNGTIYACPERSKQHCQSYFLTKDYVDIYKSAYSHIENQIKFANKNVTKGNLSTPSKKTR